MRPKVILLAVHGMGDTTRDFADAHFRRLAVRLGAAAWQQVRAETLFFQPTLQPNQEAVFTRSRPHTDWDWLRKFVLFGLSDAASLAYKPEAEGSPYELVQKIILDRLREIHATSELGDADVPVVVVAHSLGGHVISNYIWDARPELRRDAPRQTMAGVWKQAAEAPCADRSARERFERLEGLRTLVTIGCNIPVFVAGRSVPTAFDRPHPEFEWHNLYDPDDVLGWPLGPLEGKGYGDPWIHDRAINAGRTVGERVLQSWNPASHVAYWEDGDVIACVGDALAAHLGGPGKEPGAGLRGEGAARGPGPRGNR